MMKLLIALSALVALAAASEVAYKKEVKYDVKVGAYAYHGRYPGKCSNDGLYYRDAFSFVFCSNGNSYVQPCAPGTRNSGYDRYSYGGYYGYKDFCDVNLVDYGYGAKKDGYYGYDRPYGYGFDRPYGYNGYYGRPYGGPGPYYY